MRDPAQNLERLLARLFVDKSLRERFQREPEAVAEEFGLDEGAQASLAKVDRVGLELASKSYSHKRAGRGKPGWWKFARIFRGS